MEYEIKEVNTTAFDDQKPGTSGLRKKVKVFQQPNYRENFIQATFDAVSELETPISGACLVVGGDGRYLMTETLQIIFKMAYANQISDIIVGTNGFLSTPAISALIRRRKARGGIILTASHNPGGPDEDFGIKYNIHNGGPAPSSVTNAIYAKASELKSYKIADLPEVDITKPDRLIFDHLNIEIIDPVEDYANLMRELFDFDQIKQHISSGFNMHVNCLSGISGPYAKRIFVDELGADASSVVNFDPLPDFGGGHPDPNLVYAKDLVDVMKRGEHDFGAAFDGDADRNMILGKNAFFVTPSDSLAVIAANYNHIPYFAKSGLKGLSRSMPTAGAVDRVASKLGVKCYEVPTGWKFFGNLMDAELLSICGEESFGTGSDHVREKDGVWAALCWLSIMAARNQSVEEILTEHWKEYGRNYFTRYDYETVASDDANKMMEYLRALIDDQSIVGKEYRGMKLTKMDEFEYTDPTCNEVTSKQGVRIIFEDGSRIVFRLSGTGSSGATIRMYIDSYQQDEDKLTLEAAVALKPLVETALEISKLQEFTGRDEPSVIT